jgi:hypothetical protein
MPALGSRLFHVTISESRQIEVCKQRPMRIFFFFITTIRADKITQQILFEVPLGDDAKKIIINFCYSIGSCS